MTQELKRRSRRRSALALAAVVVLVVLAVAFWPAPGPGDVARQGDLARDTAAPLECEIESYPCTWAEVSPEAATRTDQIGQIAAALLHAVQDPSVVATVLAGSDELAEVDADAQAVRFRLHGGRPAFVSLPHDHGDPDGGEAGAGVAVVPQPAVSGHVPPRAPLGRVSSWAAAGLSALVPTLHAQETPAGINTPTPGSGKRALILAPYLYDRLGGEAAHIAKQFSDTKDYTPANNGSVEFYANVRPDGKANEGAMSRTVVPVQGQSTIEHFLHWRRYNFIYVATHGFSFCPTFPGEPIPDKVTTRRPANPARDQWIAEEKGPCQTYLWVEEYPADTDEARTRTQHDRTWLGYAGVVPSYRVAYSRTPGLSAADAAACLQATSAAHANAASATTPDGKTLCLKPELITTSVFVSNEFFRYRYKGGFNHTVIFLAACESLKVSAGGGSLVNVLAPAGNRNVAVFGYTVLVNSAFAYQMGREAARLFLDTTNGSFSHAEILRRLEAKAVELLEMLGETVSGNSDGEVGDFAGMARSPGGHVHDGPVGEYGGLEEASSNPTHARDIVLLIDPTTGEDLQDGASVGVRSVGGPGPADRLNVHPQLIGVAPDDAPPTTRLEVRVVGEPVPDETYRPDRQVGDGAYRYQDTVSLGRAHKVGEVVDLEVRVELPGGGESRWVYEDIRLTNRVCDLIEPVMQTIVGAFGSVPFRDRVSPFSSQCLIRLRGPSTPGPTALYAPPLDAWIIVEIGTRTDMWPGAFDAPMRPEPSLGVNAVVVEDRRQPVVLFEHGGRVWKVRGEYPDRFEIRAESPVEVDADLQFAETPVAAVIRVARVVLKELGGEPGPDPEPEPEPDPKREPEV